MRERYEAARLAMDKRHRDEMEGMRAPFEAEMAAISAPFDERLAAVEDDANDIEWDYDTCEPVVCALTGLPLFEDDPRFINEETGEVVLAAALGLPDQPEVAG